MLMSVFQHDLGSCRPADGKNKYFRSNQCEVFLNSVTRFIILIIIRTIELFLFMAVAATYEALMKQLLGVNHFSKAVKMGLRNTHALHEALNYPSKVHPCFVLNAEVL
jgi:hypothetical protein